MAKGYPVPMESKPNDDWQANCDKDALMRAAEIAADRARFRAALKKLKQQDKGINSLLVKFGEKG